MQPQLRWSKNPEENLLGSFSQSVSSAIADLDMTQMGVVGTNATIPRLTKQNGKVNFPSLTTYASCTRKLDLKIRFTATRRFFCFHVYFMQATYQRQRSWFSTFKSHEVHKSPQLSCGSRIRENSVHSKSYSGNMELDSAPERLSIGPYSYTSSCQLSLRR